MNEADEQLQILRELCSEQQLAVLATDNAAGPYTSLVAVAITPDLRKIFFATPRGTRKWGNLTGNPKVSLLIDNRNNQVKDFGLAVAATFQGVAEALSETNRESGVLIYLSRHPQMAEFIASPDTALFCVQVRAIYLVTQFQKINEYIFSQ